MVPGPDKKNGRFRDRRSHVLPFIDARKLGTLIDGVHPEPSEVDVQKIADANRSLGAATRVARRGTKTSPASARVPRSMTSATTATSLLPAARIGP